MNSKKVKEIVKFSISKNLQNKWFMILNVFILIVMLVSTNAGNIRKLLESNNIQLFNDDIVIEIVDKENLGIEKFEECFKTEEKITVRQIEENTYTKESISDSTIVVEIASSEKDIIHAVVTSKEGVDGVVYNQIIQVLSEIRSGLFSEKNHVDLSKLDILNKEIPVERNMLGVDAENYTTKEIIKQVSTILIYMISIFIFSKIANEIAQEKVSKSIEYVLTSVSEKEYLMAKIISVISLVLLQAIYFVVYYFLGNVINNLINFNTSHQTEAFNLLSLMQNIDKEIVIYILTVFGYGLLTLILMSIIQAAISSKTTNMSEAGNTIVLLTTITVVAYIFTMTLITPYTNMTPIIYIISCIPLLSNYFVPAIMIIGQATLLQIIISLVLLIVSIPVTFHICAKIFKNGVLDYKPNGKWKRKKRKIERTIKEEQEHKILVASYRRYSFVIGMSLILWVVFQIIGEVLIGTLLVPILGNVLSENQLQLVLMLLVSIIGLLIPIGFINLYIHQEDKIKRKSIGKQNTIITILIGMTVLGMIQFILPYIYKILGLEYTINTVFSSNIDGSFLTNILLFITLAVQPAIFEELLFRKAIMDYSYKMGTMFTIIFSAFLFGLVHMNLAQGIFAFLIGIVFAIIYRITGDIKITMLLHFLNNGYAALMMIFEKNQMILHVINMITIILLIIGGILLVKVLLENKKKVEFKSIDKNKIKEYRYIFLDYTFVLSIVFMIVLFSFTGKVISAM